MNDQLIIIPVLVQIILTIFLYISLNVFKVKAVKSGEVNESRRGLHDDAWPDYVLKINNCIRNQFEVPVLFYVLTILFLIIGAVDLTVLVLSWLFVVSRLAHAYIHVGSNHVPTRRKAFSFGVIVVLIMSIKLVLAAV